MPNREKLDLLLKDYFSKLDPLSLTILNEIQEIKSEFGDENFKKLSEKEQDNIIDRHFQPNIQHIPIKTGFFYNFFRLLKFLIF